MNEIKLKRGEHDVVFAKLPTQFAVRLKQGRAADEHSLEAACGTPPNAVRHIEAVAPEKMDIFAVADVADLEDTMDAMRGAPASDVVTHMYAMDETPGSAVIPTGTLTVRFGQDVSAERRRDILTEFGLEVLEELDYVPNGYTLRLTETSPENPLKIAAKLQQMDEIEVAEPDLSFQVSLKYEPADDLYAQQWHLRNRGDMLGLVAGADVKAEGAWEHTLGSRDITVCGIDDGFDLQHPDFAAPGKIVAARDFGQDDFLPNPVFADDNHGTACAGVAVAEENGSGVVGLAPRCSLMPIRMGPWLSDQAVVDMFQYTIDHHADVISCSWSAQAWNFPLSTKMHGIIHKAATEGRANGKGCVILFAAGNENRPLDGTAANGAPSHQGFALHPDVIAVAASNSLDRKSSYSNFGPELTICACSSGSPGRRVVTTDRRGANGYSSTDYANDFGGTSSSTPLTAGLAALVLSMDPSLTSAEVRQIVMNTADKIDAANGDYVDGHSPLYGHGRINAAAALEMVGGTSADRLPQVLFLEHRINRPIPDQGEAADTITFPLDVDIRELEVSLQIRHTWRGDLRIAITPPNGDGILLLDRVGGSQDDVVMSFRSADNPGLFDSLVGSSAHGHWTLRVEDHAQHDVGVIQKWGLAVTYS